MTRYVFDTNILSYLEDSSSPFYDCVSDAMASKVTEDVEVSISIVSLYEIQYRIANAKSPELKVGAEQYYQELLTHFSVLPLSQIGSEIYGGLKQTYREFSKASRRTMNAHNADFVIASTAIEHDAILVSNDSLFDNLSKITMLNWENWAE